MAKRFSGRGEPLEDLVQVACIGLTTSIDRFDIYRGHEFSTYANPTIIGELKRYFRDKARALKIPRRFQELNIDISKSVEKLSQELQRYPSIKEIALEIGVTEEEVNESMSCSNASSAVSLDGDISGEDQDSYSLEEILGRVDSNFEKFENLDSLLEVMKDLSDREKRIIRLRFSYGLTKTDIARRLGVSQMHVSRLLAKTLAILRQRLAEFNPNPSLQKKSIKREIVPVPETVSLTSVPKKAKTANIFDLTDELRVQSRKNEITHADLAGYFDFRGHKFNDLMIRILLEKGKLFQSRTKPDVFLFSSGTAEISIEQILSEMQRRFNLILQKGVMVK